ncbi:MAG: transcription antitermination factor NusB [Parasphingorhabdus sp.]|nr:transcription antitermination factor NusB [Parasphingorhabdus sp.]
MPAKSLSRSTARLAAVQALFQMDAAQTSVAQLLKEFHDHRLGAVLDDVAYADAEPDFFDDLVTGALQRREEIDVLISDRLASGWSMARLDRTMLQILRAGAFELLAHDDITTATIISEYVDLAKAFFDPRDAGFANGLLDAIAKVVRD